MIKYRFYKNFNNFNRYFIQISEYLPKNSEEIQSLNKEEKICVKIPKVLKEFDIIKNYLAKYLLGYTTEDINSERIENKNKEKRVYEIEKKVKFLSHTDTLKSILDEILREGKINYNS